MTRTPSGPHSTAAVRVNATRPAFAAAYAPNPANAPKAWTDATLTIEAGASRAATNRRLSSTGAVSVTAWVRAQPSAEPSASGARSSAKAQLTERC